jgi:hypothetical protein
MSKYHGEQYWSEMRHQALQGWRELSDDDFDTLRAMRHDHEVRASDQRTRVRRDRQIEYRDLESRSRNAVQGEYR